MLRNKLKGKIVEAGYTQRSLAKEVGMSKNTLNSKVNGKVPFNTDEIERICASLSIVDPVEKAAIFLPQASQKWDAKAIKIANSNHSTAGGDTNENLHTTGTGPEGRPRILHGGGGLRGAWYRSPDDPGYREAAARTAWLSGDHTKLQG